VRSPEGRSGPAQRATEGDRDPLDRTREPDRPDHEQPTRAPTGPGPAAEPAPSTGAAPDAGAPPGPFATARYPESSNPYPGAAPAGSPGPYPGASAGAPPGWYAAPAPAGGPAGAGGRPRRTHRWGLGAFLLVEAVFLGVSILIGFLLVDPDRPSVAALGIVLAVPTLLAAGTAVLATQLRGNGPRLDLGLVWSRRDVGIGLAFGLGGLVLTAVAGAIYVSIVGPDASSAVGEVFAGQRAGLGAALLIAVIVVLVAPLAEEIVYRGLLWGALEKHGAGRWVAFGITTVVFAVAHFEFTRAPLLLVISIPIGLARVFTGRLLASVVAHQVNNLLPGLVLMLGLLGLVPMT
jgi:membrane protease YdiL (CAAX protease family)